MGLYSYNSVEFWMIIIGGLALFLYGIHLISKTLQSIAGERLKKIIDKCASNRFFGMLTGAGFTAGIQSSGATSALTIGLVRAGLMTLVQALPIIIGANIGTTITAFIISIPVMEFMPIILLAGSFIVMLATRKKYKSIGELCFSIGLIFFGLWVMQMNLGTLKDAPFMNDFFTFLTNYPWLGLLLGAVITALLQSSSAVVGITQGIYAASILSGSPISLFGILPIVFGSNIGSTSTAIISSVGGSKDSKRVALFHFIFNLVGALICMGFLYIFKSQLLNSPSWNISPKLQLAIAHLIFNVFTAILFMPLITPMAKLLCKIIKGNDHHNELTAIKELDKGTLKRFPSEGILMAKDVVITMFGYTKTMFETINEYLKTSKSEDSEFVHQIEESVDSIDRNLNEYLLGADKGELNQTDLKTFTSVLRGSKDIERIGDYAENIIAFFENMNERKEKLSKEQFELFSKCTIDASKLIEQSISVFKSNDEEGSKNVIQIRRELNANLDKVISDHFSKMKKESDKVQYIELVYVDIINAYQRVYSHCSDVAKLIARDKTYEISDEEMKRFSSMRDRY